MERVKALLSLMLTTTVSALLAYGCNIDDDRDLCCEKAAMHYRFYYNGKDRFKEYIRAMRYFLFDGSGLFLQELYAENDLQTVSLEALPEGKYTLVAIGNMGSSELLSGYADKGLDAFRLHVVRISDKWLTDADRIFWGAKTFERRGRQSLMTEMSAIHCRMRIRVEWERKPTQTEGYRYELDKIAEGYDLCPDRAKDYMSQLYPEACGELCAVKHEVYMYQMELEDEIVTLRYADNRIPIFQLWRNEEPVTKRIDLAKAFRQWGWSPDVTPMQDYRIRLLLRKDGSVVVSPVLEIGVNDWIDGGDFG